MNCGIYRITNLINGKCYIGQSVNIKERFVHHKNSAFNTNYKSYDYPLYRAFRKYGVENFEFSVLEYLQKEELNVREKFWISFYKSNDKNFGYNQTEGGQSVTTKTLNWEQVDQIINLLLTTQLPQSEIAKQFNVSQMAISDINTGSFWHKEYLCYPLRKYANQFYDKFTKHGNNYCKKCGTTISKDANYCVKCKGILSRKTERPNREELKKLIRNESFVMIGKKFGVTDNAVRKWCKNEKLPYKKLEINSYSNEEWNNI